MSNYIIYSDLLPPPSSPPLSLSLPLLLRNLFLSPPLLGPFTLDFFVSIVFILFSSEAKTIDAEFEIQASVRRQ